METWLALTIFINSWYTAAMLWEFWACTLLGQQEGCLRRSLCYWPHQYYWCPATTYIYDRPWIMYEYWLPKSYKLDYVGHLSLTFKSCICCLSFVTLLYVGVDRLLQLLLLTLVWILRAYALNLLMFTGLSPFFKNKVYISVKLCIIPFFLHLASDITCLPINADVELWTCRRHQMQVVSLR